MNRLPARPLADALTSARLDPDHPLTWRRTVPMAWEFELVQEGVVLGEMEFTAVPHRAVGECLGRELELRAERRFLAGVEALSLGADGSGGPSFRGLLPGVGRMRAADGGRFLWRRGGFGFYHTILKDARGRRVLHIRPAFLRFLHSETTVRIGPAGLHRDDLPELLLFTWFLRMQSEPRFGQWFKGRGR